MTQVVTSLSIFVVHVCLHVQINVPELLHQATVTQAVQGTMMFVVFVIHLLHHPPIQFVQQSVLLLLPLETVTQAVISLLIFVVSVSQHALENVRRPSIQENVIQVVMRTLTFVENVSLFMFHLHHPQQHVLHHHLGQLHVSVQLNARMP